MHCIFCNSDQVKTSYLPSTYFNNKTFDYLKCKNCQLIFISPLPNEDDLLKMYPPSYQDGVDFSILKQPYKKLIGLRFSYGYQFDQLKELNIQGKMIDVGCGNAHFLVNAKDNGLHFNGAEFNPKHVDILKIELPDHDFYTIDELLNSDEKFDLIRLSNVFEHFTDPKATMLKLKEKLNKNGYFLIEGPIETNFNLALQFRKFYFRLRKRLNSNYKASHTPTHIVFTNRKNQKQFFKDLGLKEHLFTINEAEWPFPQNLKAAKGVVQKLNVLVARTSMFLSKFNKQWGNTFLYIGKN